MSQRLSKEGYFGVVAIGFDSAFTFSNPTYEAEDLLVAFFQADVSEEYKLAVQLRRQAIKGS